MCYFLIELIVIAPLYSNYTSKNIIPLIRHFMTKNEEMMKNLKMLLLSKYIIFDDNSFTVLLTRRQKQKQKISVSVRLTSELSCRHIIWAFCFTLYDYACYSFHMHKFEFCSRVVVSSSIYDECYVEWELVIMRHKL